MKILHRGSAANRVVATVTCLMCESELQLFMSDLQCKDVNDYERGVFFICEVCKNTQRVNGIDAAVVDNFRVNEDLRLREELREHAKARLEASYGDK